MIPILIPEKNRHKYNLLTNYDLWQIWFMTYDKYGLWLMTLTIHLFMLHLCICKYGVWRFLLWPMTEPWENSNCFQRLSFFLFCSQFCVLFFLKRTIQEWNNSRFLSSDLRLFFFQIRCFIRFDNDLHI